MIKGAFILTLGFGLGYAAALHDQDEIRAAAAAIKQVIDEGRRSNASTTTTRGETP